MRQMALRARRLARTLPGDEAGKRLDAYADELEARARAIERERGLPPLLANNALSDISAAVSRATM
jgi:hypothetical protein